jgi:hypothetical protein
MNELFHTEDCGISLICRCCRGPVCEQRLTKADRLRVQRDLWEGYSQTRQSFAIKISRRHLKNVFGCFAPEIIKRLAGWVLHGQKNGEASPSKKTAETTDWRTP